MTYISKLLLIFQTSDLTNISLTDKQFFVIADVCVQDPEAFVNEYAPKTAHMKEQGKVNPL